MVRGVLAFPCVMVVLTPVHAVAQNLIVASRLEVTASPRSCQPDQWCLSLEVLDSQTLQPLETPWLYVAGCGTVLGDTAGRVQIVCSQTGRLQLRVQALGWEYASGSLPVELGHSYTGTARLVPVDNPEPEGFSIPLAPCAASNQEDQRRCLAFELEQEQRRLVEELDSARVNTPRTLSAALLDSAQAAWERFVPVQCRGEASLAATPSAAAIADLDCRLRLTEARIYELGAWVWKPRREPPNRRLKLAGPVRSRRKGSLAAW
jgi:uncharacterized protein YecT (DUF1311 family)